MQNKKVIVVGSDYKWEEEQLLKAYKNTEFWLLNDLEVEMGSTTKFLLNGKDVFKNLNGDEYFIIRRSRGSYQKLVALVDILEKQNFTITDSFRSVVTNLNKEIFLTTLESNLFPHPPGSFFVESGKNIESKKEGFNFPILSKPVLGRHGEGVLIHDDFKSLQKEVNKSEQNLLIQNFLELDSEYRIFVVGNKALGAVAKKAAPGKKIANYAAGAKFEPVELSEEHLNEAIRLCQLQEIDIGGVDVVKTKDGRWYLLEINRCPEFQAFSSATKINVANEIIEFIKNKN